jgi:transcriptional regulator with XRE-family HTH domain
MSNVDLPDPNSSLYAWLAHDLRFYRLKHGLSQAQLGAIIRRSPSSLSNCEAGRRKITAKEAKILDDLWDTGGHFQRLLLFARLSHDPDWFRGLWVPGLNQTPEYARASFTAAGISNIDALIEARTARQAILDRKNPPLLWILLDHAVLDRPVGGPDVMREQLSRLHELSQRPNVILQVVPRSAGAHMGQDGAFKVLTVEATEVAYVEAPGGGRLILDDAEVRSFGVRYGRIGAKALADDPSRDLIIEAMESMQ